MLQADGGRDAECVAGHDIAHHDLVAGRRRLAGADMAVQQKKERGRIRALFEHCGVAGYPDGARLTQHLGEVLGGEAGKQRQMCDQ